jgi:hypothetical protein
MGGSEVQIDVWGFTASHVPYTAKRTYSGLVIVTRKLSNTSTNLWLG